MYKEEWVQQLIRTIQTYLVDNHAWVDINPSKAQRVLDYACGHGTVSGVSQSIIGTKLKWSDFDLRHL